MSYEVALLVFGILLLLVGLVGKVKAKELEVGTSSTIIRIVTGLVGVALIVLSLAFTDLAERFSRTPAPTESAQTDSDDSHEEAAQVRLAEEQRRSEAAQARLAEERRRREAVQARVNVPAPRPTATLRAYVGIRGPDHNVVLGHVECHRCVHRTIGGERSVTWFHDRKPSGRHDVPVGG